MGARSRRRAPAISVALASEVLELARSARRSGSAAQHRLAQRVDRGRRRPERARSAPARTPQRRARASRARDATGVRTRAAPERRGAPCRRRGPSRAPGGDAARPGPAHRRSGEARARRPSSRARRSRCRCSRAGRLQSPRPRAVGGPEPVDRGRSRAGPRSASDELADLALGALAELAAEPLRYRRAEALLAAVDDLVRQQVPRPRCLSRYLPRRRGPSSRGGQRHARTRRARGRGTARAPRPRSPSSSCRRASAAARRAAASAPGRSSAGAGRRPALALGLAPRAARRSSYESGVRARRSASTRSLSVALGRQIAPPQKGSRPAAASASACAWRIAAPERRRAPQAARPIGAPQRARHALERRQ